MMQVPEDTGPDNKGSYNSKLLKIGIVYFALFLGHGIWRTSLHSHAVNNMGLDGSQIGYVFSVTYIPGIFAFTIGLVARKIPLYQLLVIACLTLAGGLFIVSGTSHFTVLIVATLLIAFGFNFFYTVANSACLLGSDRPHASYELGKLKSFGPLAGFVAASILVAIFAPDTLWRWGSVVDSSAILESIGRLLTLAQSTTELDGLMLRSLLAGLAGLLLLLGVYVGATIRLSYVGRSLGRFNIRRHLFSYYALNFLAGCRSAIFQTFALFVMVKQYDLSISGTAMLVMVSQICSFSGYRFVGYLLQRFTHRQVLTLIYGTVALNFFGFWLLLDTAGSSDFTVLGLALLFLIDSFLFGASVVTDSHLKLTSEPRDYVGDIGVGMSMFSIAAWLMSMLASQLWEPLGNAAFLLGSLVCLLAILIGYLTLNLDSSVDRSIL